MSQDDMKILAQLGRNLTKLLENPQPGNLAWHRAVQTTIRHISDYED